MEDLPEVELGIDMASYEHYCDISEAVDVETEEFEIRCSDGITLQGSEGDLGGTLRRPGGAGIVNLLCNKKFEQ